MCKRGLIGLAPASFLQLNKEVKFHQYVLKMLQKSETILPQNIFFPFFATVKLFWSKMADTYGQFHQRFLRAFFIRNFGAKLKRNLAPKIHTKNALKKR